MMSATDDTPPSPSLSSTSILSSVSWMQKSPNELIPMLKNAYSTLKDKEKDLRLAAEIGKSLLENNLALKSNYEDLLSNAPYPTPSNSGSLLLKSESPKEEEEEQNLRYITTHSTREALVEMLEKKNQDLSQQLETVLLNQEKLDRSHTKKARQLEHEVKFLQASLDHATLKIQEMESAKKTLTKVDSLHNTNANLTDEVRQTPCCHDLSAKMEQLKLEHDHVSQSKAQVEGKLMATLHDLRVLKEQFTQFQFTTQDHEQLRETFHTQNAHIKELTQTLEEHRSALTRLRERGIYIPSTATSMIDGEEMGKSTKEIQNNLLFELENAWNKHQTESSLYGSSNVSSTYSSSSKLLQPFQTIYNQLPNVDSALESIILKAGVVERDALDDALSLIGRLENEYDHERFLLEKRHIYYRDDDDDVDLYNHRRPRSQGELYFPEHQQSLVTVTPKESLPGLVGYSQKIIKYMMYLTWRWFRFTLIMTIAIFMSLKEGPDGLSSPKAVL